MLHNSLAPNFDTFCSSVQDLLNSKIGDCVTVLCCLREKEKVDFVSKNGNKIIKNRIPSTLCCNEYNIVIGYYFIEEFTLVKVCSVSTQYVM